MTQKLWHFCVTMGKHGWTFLFYCDDDVGSAKKTLNDIKNILYVDFIDE